MKGYITILNLVIASLAVASKEKCPVDQETDYSVEKLLRHDDCNKFYKCKFGELTEFECHENRHFNLETWQCDWEFNVDCTDRNVPIPSTTTSPITSTSIPTTTTASPTTTAPTTTTIAPPTTTVAPITTTTLTEAPTTTIATTTVPTTTQEVTANPDDLANGCPVDPKIHRLLPHESDCTLFYYCVWGQLQLRECGLSGLTANGRLHFNKNLQVCDWPNNAGCVSSFNKHLDGRLEMMAR